MPTDPTTTEKAERLGLHRTSGSWLDASGMPRAWKGKRAGQWYRSGARGTTTEAEAIDALYAERFPAPDYRAALEALERDAIALLDILDRSEDATEAIHGDAYHPNLQDDVYNAKSAVRTALTHARKVLHGQ